MRREVHVRFCERLAVTFRGPTLPGSAKQGLGLRLTWRLFPCKDGGQMPEFGLHRGGIGHSIRDLLAKKFAIPFTKPVNRYLQRPLRRVQFLSECGVRRV